jgi:hypothetical protein
VARTLAAFRERVAELYQRTAAGPERDDARAALERETRAELASLDLTHRDGRRLAERVRLNDACQALIGTYHGDLPRHAERLGELGGDLRAFMEDARRAAEERPLRAKT